MLLNKVNISNNSNSNNNNNADSPIIIIGWNKFKKFTLIIQDSQQYLLANLLNFNKFYIITPDDIKPDVYSVFIPLLDKFTLNEGIYATLYMTGIYDRIYKPIRLETYNDSLWSVETKKWYDWILPKIRNFVSINPLSGRFNLTLSMHQILYIYMNSNTNNNDNTGVYLILEDFVNNNFWFIIELYYFKAKYGNIYSDKIIIEIELVMNFNNIKKYMNNIFDSSPRDIVLSNYVSLLMVKSFSQSMKYNGFRSENDLNILYTTEWNNIINQNDNGITKSLNVSQSSLSAQQSSSLSSFSPFNQSLSDQSFNVYSQINLKSSTISLYWDEFSYWMIIEILVFRSILLSENMWINIIHNYFKEFMDLRNVDFITVMKSNRWIHAMDAWSIFNYAADIWKQSGNYLKRNKYNLIFNNNDTIFDKNTFITWLYINIYGYNIDSMKNPSPTETFNRLKSIFRNNNNNNNTNEFNFVKKILLFRESAARYSYFIELIEFPHNIKDKIVASYNKSRKVQNIYRDMPNQELPIKFEDINFNVLFNMSTSITSINFIQRIILTNIPLFGNETDMIINNQISSKPRVMYKPVINTMPWTDIINLIPNDIIEMIEDDIGNYINNEYPLLSLPLINTNSTMNTAQNIPSPQSSFTSPLASPSSHLYDNNRIFYKIKNNFKSIKHINWLEFKPMIWQDYINIFDRDLVKTQNTLLLSYEAGKQENHIIFIHSHNNINEYDNFTIPYGNSTLSNLNLNQNNYMENMVTKYIQPSNVELFRIMDNIDDYANDINIDDVTNIISLADWLIFLYNEKEEFAMLQEFIGSLPDNMVGIESLTGQIYFIKSLFNHQIINNVLEYTERKNNISVIPNSNYSFSSKYSFSSNSSNNQNKQAINQQRISQGEKRQVSLGMKKLSLSSINSKSTLSQNVDNINVRNPSTRAATNSYSPTLQAVSNQRNNSLISTPMNSSTRISNLNLNLTGNAFFGHSILNYDPPKLTGVIDGTTLIDVLKSQLVFISPETFN